MCAGVRKHAPTLTLNISNNSRARANLKIILDDKKGQNLPQNILSAEGWPINWPKTKKWVKIFLQDLCIYMNKKLLIFEMLGLNCCTFN